MTSCSTLRKGNHGNDRRSHGSRTLRYARELSHGVQRTVHGAFDSAGHGNAGFGFGGFFGAVLGRGGGFEGAEQAHGDAGDFVDGGLERFLVGLGRFVEAGDFADELERGVANLIGSDRWIKVIERFDVSTRGYGGG